MNNKLEVIGIDHGWSMMKTVTQVFVTGVKEITTTPALFGDVLEYDGKYYKIGTVRQEVKDTKVEDDSFYLLTLAAVAKELKKRGLSDAKVFLAVGLPLTRFGAERNNFIKYLTKNKRVDFRYENEAYHIEIDDVAVFPQCYAAVVDKIPTMAKKTLVVDIGSWTIDIMPVINKSPDESKCVTVPRGLITCMLDYEKSLGKTSMRKLLLKGGDLQVLQFKTEDMRKVERMAKKYGILYSVLPDCNKTDGMSEVIFHTEAVPRVNMMIQKLKFGRIATFDDYLKNGDEKSLGKLMDFLRKQQGNEKSHTVEGDKVNSAIDGLIEKVGMFAMEKQAISVEQVKENFSINGEQAENVIKQLETIGVLGGRSEDGTHKVMMDKEAFTNRIRGYQSLADRMRAISASKNTNLSDVTISKKLIAEENDHAVKTRVPGTWGKDVRYVWLHKENVMDIHNGKTMLTFLDTSKDYKLYDEQNRVVTTKKGDELYTHYDKVESSVRERYEKVQKEQKKTTKKKTVTTRKER